MGTKMKVDIYGAGCDKFFQTVKSIRYAIQKYDIACEYNEITDGKKIASHNITSLPAVFINDKLILQGEGVSVEKARDILEAVQAAG